MQQYFLLVHMCFFSIMIMYIILSITVFVTLFIYTIVLSVSSNIYYDNGIKQVKINYVV